MLITLFLFGIFLIVCVFKHDDPEAPPASVAANNGASAPPFCRGRARREIVPGGCIPTQ
jgi:hypothetical protein